MINFGSRKTVAGVLSVFNKTVRELEAVEAENKAEAARQAQAIEEAKAAHAVAANEAANAREVADKLLSLISSGAIPVPPALGGAE